MQEDLGSELENYSSLFMSKDEIETNIQDIKEKLFPYDLKDAEVFSQQITQIQDRKTVLEVKKALESARTLYNLIRLYNHTDLLEKMDFQKVNSLYSETSRHLDMLNLKEKVKNQVDTTNLLYEALENVVFLFRKISEEEMIIAEKLKDTLKKTREALSQNFDQKDPEFVSLYEELKRLFHKKNLDEITQVFLYKFLNDKFSYDIKKYLLKLKNGESWEKAVEKLSPTEYDNLLLNMEPGTARLKREHYLSYLINRANENEFAKLFDNTLRDISHYNNDVFSVKTGKGAKIVLFDELSNFITDPAQKDNFCKAILNPLTNFSFEQVFHKKFDYFSTIFEYLIKDYNKDGGGKYAEYFTPNAVAKIMASILVDKKVSSVTCYDPAAGSGTLLMNLAHAIGEDNCTIYSQDISQKSSSMLRLNLILNDLVHSISHIIQGNTLLTPYHKMGDKLRTFDFIVSNPPFKLDFSDYRDDLDTTENHFRFFAGIPNVPNKDKDKMAIYLLFIQHIIFSFNQHKAVEDFSVIVSYDQIKEKNYSLSAGQYFDVKIEYVDITPKEFKTKMETYQKNLDSMFAESKKLEKEIQKQLSGLKYEF